MFNCLRLDYTTVELAITTIGIFRMFTYKRNWLSFMRVRKVQVYWVFGFMVIRFDGCDITLYAFVGHGCYGLVGYWFCFAKNCKCGW